jgi:hypothetical protein
MYVEENLKAEIVAEALQKKWFGHLGDARWPNVRSRSAVYRFGWPSAGLAQSAGVGCLTEVP